MTYRVGPARVYSASAETMESLNGSPRSSSPAQYSNRSPRIYSDSAARAGPRRKSRNRPLISGLEAHRCRSEMRRTAMAPRSSDVGGGSDTDPPRSRFLDHFGPLDDYVFNGHVRVKSALACLDPFYPVHDILAMRDLAEDAVPPGIRARRSVVEKTIVLHVDEELAGGGMRLGRSRHGDRIPVVLQPVVCLVLDRSAG